MTSAVKVEGLNGDYSFRFSQTSFDLSAFASKENAGNYIKPKLVIETTPPADTRAPDTSVGTVTQSDAGGRDASIPFSGTDNVGVTGFECRLDGAAYAACTSPKTYNDLAVGSHTFDVRARDAAGNADLSPASVTFTVSQPRVSGTFPGIRWYPIMGVYAGADQGWVHDANIVDQQFNEFVGSANENAYLDLDRDGERYWFCGGRNPRT